MSVGVRLRKYFVIPAYNLKNFKVLTWILIWYRSISDSNRSRHILKITRSNHNKNTRKKYSAHTKKKKGGWRSKNTQKTPYFSLQKFAQKWYTSHVQKIFPLVLIIFPQKIKICHNFKVSVQQMNHHNGTSSSL